MSENHDNSTVVNSDLERTPSTHQKVHYTHDQKKFIKVFPELIEEASTLGSVCSCNLERDVLWQGKIYPTAYHICFYGKIFAKAAKVTIHFKDITQIEKRSTVGMFPNAIRINTANIEYVFSSFLKRDVTYQAFCDAWHRIKSNNEIHSIEPLNLASHVNQQEIEEPIDREINGHKKSNSMDQIDATAFVNDEIKRINEEDLNMLSQSYPESSPIEKVSQIHVSESDLRDSNEVSSPQISSEGFQNKMLDNVYNMDTKGLYQLLFEDNSKFLYDVYKNANNENIKIHLWKKDARTNLKERVIMYNSLNKSLFSSRGNVLTEEKQKFLRNDKDNFFIESEIKILNINYSDYFKIICKYFIIAEREDYSRLLVTFEIKFNKKFALSDKVEKTMCDNYTRLFNELEYHLNKTVKKASSDDIKSMTMNSTEEINKFDESLASNERAVEVENSTDTLFLNNNDKKRKSSNSESPTSEKLDDGFDKPQIMHQFFNTKIFRTPLFNYLLDAVFLLINILFQIPSFLIHITNSVISLFKQREQQKHGSKKKSAKDEKKILTSAPYLIIVLGFLLLVGTVITFSNAYYVRKLQEMEQLIKNNKAHKINPSLISKINEDLKKGSSPSITSERDIMESLLGSSYERYNHILKRYNKQKEKHEEDFNLSYVRLNQQIELMNKKFDIMKNDVNSIMKDFSSEGLANLVKELENVEKDKSI